MKRVKNEEMAIGTAFDLFIKDKQSNGVKKCTTDCYRYGLITFLREMDLTDDALVTELNYDSIQEFKSKLITKYSRVATVNNYITGIKAFCSWLSDQNIIQPFKINKVKGQQEKISLYTDEEIKKLLDVDVDKLSYVEYRTYVIICFCLSTGARASTIINIRVSDIDFNDRTVVYRHLKNGKTAIIPLSSAAVKVLQKFYRAYQREKPDGYFFCEGNESQCTVHSIYQAHERYCEKRGVEGKGLHALRHYYTSKCVQAGMNMAIIQRMLCHSSIQMTAHYTHIFDGSLRNSEQYCPLDTLTTSTRAYTLRKRI